MKIRAVITIIIGGFIFLVGPSFAGDVKARLTIEPAIPVDGQLLHGLTLTAADGQFPILVKVDRVERPFVGHAHLQAPGRAMIRIVAHGNVRVSGYVVSQDDNKAGVALKCLQFREVGSNKECVVGDVASDVKVKVVFPEGVDIAEWKTASH